MKLTKWQYNGMRMALNRKDSGVTIGPYMPHLLFLVGLGALGAFLAIYLQNGMLGAFCIGASFAGLIENVIQILGVRHVWPAYREAFDWDKLTKMIESREVI